jgi:hypothetical protein
MNTTVINSVAIEFNEFNDYTAVVNVTSSKDESATFYVQLTDGEYRSDLGCWITTESSNGNIDIDYDYYPDFDFDDIIKAAEKCYQSQVKEIATDFNSKEDQEREIFRRKRRIHKD